MKKEYIKPIIEYCPLESDIIAASVKTNNITVDDSGMKNNVNNLNGQKDVETAPAESKDNFWNLWEDDDMEFEF
ncbi:MAG: hypothetical protein MR561_02500 [Prevotella sp.]|nr:hypothetical protein [Prevotella sp.]